MKDFLNDFSAGKIEIKYHLIKPMYSKKKRGVITLITSLVVFAAILGIVKALSAKGMDNTWIILIITIFMISVPTFIIGKVLLRYTVIGRLSFYEDHLTIEQDEETQQLNYQDILKIEYCGSLPQNIFTNVGMDRPYVSYKVRFYTGIKDHQTIDVARDMFLLPEEKALHRKIHPIIERTLKAIQPRYGLAENSELRNV